MIGIHGLEAKPSMEVVGGDEPFPGQALNHIRQGRQILVQTRVRDHGWLPNGLSGGKDALAA